MVTAYLVLLAALVAERLWELQRSRRNAAWAFDRGAVEVGHGHLRAMQALHAVFFAACVLEVVWFERPFLPLLAAPMAGGIILAQALRYWAVASLGSRWNIRAIVVPNAPVITSGPYRFVRHPNYAAVMLEGIAIPLVHTAWVTAIGFTLLNAWLLHARIRHEEAALSKYTDYDQQMAGRSAFVPTRRSLGLLDGR